MENRLDTIAMIYLIISIFAAGILIFLSQEELYKQAGLSAVFVGAAFGALFQGVISWALLESFAEVIRLLKKSNNISYYGSISGDDGDNDDDGTDYNQDENTVRYAANRTKMIECNSCGAKIDQNDSYCTVCGQKNITA